MEKRELEVMWSYYYGMSKVTMIWEQEMRQLHEKGIIKKIYEIIDDEFNEVWYLIRDIKEKSYILKSKCGNEYARDIMKIYKSNYNFYTISSEVIKIFDKGIFPVIFKIPSDRCIDFYNEKNNINKAFFNNYYVHSKDGYKAIREFRNKVEIETFNKEEDAIYWCSDFSITKQLILDSDVRPLNLIEMVCEYRM